MAKQLNVNLAFTADTTQAKKNILDLQNSLRNISSIGFNNSALTKDMEQAVASARQLQMHLNNAFNSNTGNFEALGFGYDFLDTYIKMIDEVTASDIIRVANKYFNEIYVESTVK